MRNLGPAAGFRVRMGRPLALIASLLALGLAGSASAAEPTAPPLALYGSSGGVTKLARLDPLTLAAREPSAQIHEWHDGYDISPDERFGVFTVSSNALPTTPGTGRVGIRVFDLETMELAAEFRTGVAGMAVAWLTPRRIVTAVQGGSVFLLDPTTGTVERTGNAGSGECIDPPGKGSTGRLLVMALGRRLSTVDKHGRVRSVALSGVGAKCARQGFALDPVRNRAYVFGAGRRAARVSLGSMRAGFVALPDLDADAVADTDGLLLGEDRVAAMHTDTRGRPKGVELIDFAARSRRMVDRAAGRAVLGDGLLLAYDGRSAGDAGGSKGLRAYSRSGALRFRVLTGEVVNHVQTRGRFAYALTAGGLRVVDLRTRELVRRAPYDAELELHFLAR